MLQRIPINAFEIALQVCEMSSRNVHRKIAQLRTLNKIKMISHLYFKVCALVQTDDTLRNLSQLWSSEWIFVKIYFFFVVIIFRNFYFRDSVVTGASFIRAYFN